MKKIPMSCGSFALVDDSDFKKVIGMKWQLHKKKSGARYAKCSGNKSKAHPKILMHRLIMGAKKGQQIDHVDLNGLNNQKSNLRFCSHSEQMRNRPRIKSNGFKGVYFQPKSARRPFYVKIGKSRKCFYGGSFSSELEAAKVYDTMAVKLFGDFAATNASLGLIKNSTILESSGRIF